MKLKNKKKIIIISIFFIVFVIIGLVIKDNFVEQRIAILTYHGVVDEVENVNGVDISTDYFKKQMKWLADNNYRTITMDEFYNWKKGKLKLPLKTVMIVFDDGWRNNYLNALPILEKYNLKASIFVTWKYSENSNRVENPIYINDNDIEFIDKKYDSIQLLSHSYDLHIREKAESKKYDIYNEDMLKVKSLGKNMDYYAYPFGVTNDEYIKALRDNECKLAFTFGPYDFASKNDNDYKIPRIGVFESTSFEKLKLKLLINSILNF